MENIKPSFSELFEPVITYPNPDMQDRLSSLVGLDNTKDKVSKMLGLLVNPEGVQQWLGRYHPGAVKTMKTVLRRPPLMIFAGDVGSGKSELAYTIGDAVARMEDIDIELFPLSLSTRGQGRVGQMTQLISAAFGYTIERAKKLKSATGKSRGSVILLVDEADALAQSRENAQMHHEDKAGVNAFIRGIDSLGNGMLPAAAIMCTNRPSALDPAIKRRAADIIIFERPGTETRYQIIHQPLKELGLPDKSIHQIAALTGPTAERDYGFTSSDLVQRLLPAIVLDAYPSVAVTAERAIEITKLTLPTLPFKDL